MSENLIPPSRDAPFRALLETLLCTLRPFVAAAGSCFVVSMEGPSLTAHHSLKSQNHIVRRELRTLRSAILAIALRRQDSNVAECQSGKLPCSGVDAGLSDTPGAPPGGAPSEPRATCGASIRAHARNILRYGHTFSRKKISPSRGFP